MKYRVVNTFALIVFVALASAMAFGQVTSSLSGTVTDPDGAVVSGATVVVKNDDTGAEFRATTSSNGTYTVPSLGTGTYTVTVTATGFKQVTVQGVKIDAGTPATTNVTLEVGAATESIVEQGGGEVVQTQSANISTTLNVTQIASLPLVSRNPLNFVTLLPGVNTASINRNSTINGLPTSTIDITLDGINIQDNFQKSTDGFFSRVAPSLDSVQEVSVSTATPEAQGAAHGGAQIKFITRQGTNEFHGGLYEYFRNPWLNSNYWFTNRDVAPYNVETAQNCTAANYDPERCKAPRARVLFNQYGGRLGGPILIPKLFNGRNRAFFFVNYEESQQPSQVSRQRTILTPDAQAGLFRYAGAPAGINLLQLAAARGHTSTIDPVIGKLLSDILGATNGTGGITALSDPNVQRFTYNPSGSNTSKRPTVRFDVNLTEKHHFETTWTYTDQRGGPDFLNNVEPQFPGFPNQGSQPADRYTGAVAVRSTLTPTLVNEARAGLSGGPSRFNPTASAVDFSGTVANQAGFNLNFAPPNASSPVFSTLTTATATSAPSRRNPKFSDISDTVNWTRGAHSLSFGGRYSWVTLTFNQQTLVPTINFGVDTNDPANAMFTTANFPNASATDLNNARALYAILTGRVTAINANARLVEEKGQYVYLGNAFERGRQREWGFFGQDSWRMRPNFTLNYGLRWELQLPPITLNSSYATVSPDALWGVSGAGNLFKPGTLAGKVTQFDQFKEGTPAYNNDYSNFAPSLGFAWSPDIKNGWLKRIVGEGGQTVVRGGYSLSYSRQGINAGFRGIFSANPGITITTNRDLTIGNLVGGSLGSLPLLLRETGRLGPPSFQATPTYPFTAQITNSANIIDPNIKAPYVQSWTFGIQREFTKDMAIEVRYVGNRFLQDWVTYNLNSVENNIVENGLLNEFKLAQANLRANIGAGRGNTFAYFGPNTGTSPLPIALAYFAGFPASQAGDPTRYTTAAASGNSNFTSSTFVNTLALNNPNICNPTVPGGAGACVASSYSASLDSNATFRANALRAGLPANFMLTNPDLRGGANLTSNGGYTTYNALQLELRRCMSKGLLVQTNYQFAKAFSSSRVSFRAPRVNTLETSNRGTLRHAFKLNWVYELLIGRGKTLFGNSGNLLDRLIGGWEFDGTGRVQSGQLFDLSASNAGPLNLVGMTMKELRDAYKLRFDDAKKH